MKRISVALLIMLSIAVATIGSAQEPLKLKGFEEFANGLYAIQGRTMVVITKTPMMTTRLGIYGNIQNVKGQTVVDTKQKADVTPQGMEVYDRLMSVKNPGGLYAFKVVVLEHDRVSIVAYLSTDWNAHLDTILQVFQGAQ